MAINKIEKIEIERILPNPFQPRKNLNKEKIEELANSIKKVGLLQPIIVNVNDKNEIKLIAGQRRLEAFKLLNNQTIECLVLVGNSTEKDFRQASIIENIQREEMTTYDLAVSIKELKELGLSLNDISKNIGKSISWISKALSGLNLSELDNEIKNYIENGELEISKAALIATDKTLNNDEKKVLVKEVVEKNISKNNLEKKHLTVKDNSRSDEIINLEKKFSEILKAEVVIDKSKLSIKYKTYGELENILNLIEGK